MANFKYMAAYNLEEALDFLSSHKNAHLLAGGLDVILKIKHGQLHPNVLVSINRIAELKFVEKEGDDIRIGPLLTLNELLREPIIKQNTPMLFEIARKIGSPEVRNAATIGGNICSSNANCAACGQPGCKGLSSQVSNACKNAAFSDMLVPFIALDASVVLISSTGERVIKLEDFKGKPDCQNGEIIKSINYKNKENLAFGLSYLKTAKAMGVTEIAVAAILEGNSSNNLRGAVIIAGSSFRRAAKMTFENVSAGEIKGENFLNKVIISAQEQLSYANSMVFSLNYRQAMTEHLIKDAITKALEDGYEKGHFN